MGLTPGVVTFLPAVADTPPLYRDADIVVLTSDCEGTPNVVLEAMASGLPVVATAVGGVPEVVVEDETGFLCPASSEDLLVDRLLRLIHDESLRKAMGERGREHVESRFSPAILPGCLEEFYRWTQLD